ncbi:hypothetical protein [Wolbachia pipientis]|nr:hypothetical protein [Wolbachia pipientis]
MSVWLNKILVTVFLVTFAFVPHVAQASQEGRGVIIEILVSMKNNIKDMNPTVMLCALIALILFIVMFRSFIVLMVVLCMLFILFDSPQEIIDCVREKINSVMNSIDLRKTVITDIIDQGGKEGTKKEGTKQEEIKEKMVKSNNTPK